MVTRKKARRSQKSSSKSPAKSSAKKTARSKSPKKSSAENYTRPELRERIKKRVVAETKGGRAGQWSARKAQIVAQEYQSEGGSYKHPRDSAQKSLKKWGDERWRTADGEQAIQGDRTRRYLPDSAWKKLSTSQRKATDRKKVAGSKRGKQFVANTSAAARARRRAHRKSD
jgi:hypothetical protein